MVKHNKELIVKEILKLIEKGNNYGTTLALNKTKWKLGRNTFIDYWKEAKKQHETRLKKATKAADTAYIKKAETLAVEGLMSQVEAQKITSDIARGNLADYMTIRRVEYTPRIEISLSAYIRQLQDTIDFEDEVADMSGYKDDELGSHIKQQESRRKEIVRCQVELRKRPNATKIVSGETEWKEVADLDIVKLVRDKEQGRIKSLAHTKEGLKVEMYGADSALVNVLKMHGAFEKDNEQSKPVIKSNFNVRVIPPPNDD